MLPAGGGKALKAIIAKNTGELPPRLHNLPRLAELAEIGMDPKMDTFIGELSGYYIQSRCPDEITDLSQSIDHAAATNMLKQADEVTQWLLSMLA